MSFRYSTRVRFHDADPAGIAFFANVFRWCHDGYEELMRAGGVPLAKLVADGVGLPLAHASADYVRPLPYDSELTIVIDVVEMKEKGFTLSHLVLGSDGQSAARVKTVHVSISRQTMRPVPVPEVVVTALKAHLQG